MNRRFYWGLFVLFIISAVLIIQHEQKQARIRAIVQKVLREMPDDISNTLSEMKSESERLKKDIERLKKSNEINWSELKSLQDRVQSFKDRVQTWQDSRKTK